MTGGSVRQFCGKTGGEEPLEMIMHEKDVEVLRAGLMPECGKPGKGHGKENQETEPEPHPDDFFEVFLDNEEGKDA